MRNNWRGLLDLAAETAGGAVAPVSAPIAASVAAPAAVSTSAAVPSAAVKWSDLPSLGGLDPFKADAANVEKALKMAGYTGPMTTQIGQIEAGAANESGAPSYEAVYGPTDAAKAALDNLRFLRYQSGGDSYADVYDQAGKMAGTIKLQDVGSSWADKLVPLVVGAGSGAVLGNALGLIGAPAQASSQAASQAAPVFNAAADSQLASSQLGITGAQSAAAATAPAAVDLGSLGGITSTAAPMPIDALRASELAGYSSAPAATTAPAVTAPAASGGLLGNATGLLGDAATWMKDNPVLAKLLMGGATSLLSATGSNNTAPTKNYGPAVQWKSNLQQGLLTPTPQQMPQAIQNKPAGLLAQGQTNDGAWRYLRG